MMLCPHCGMEIQTRAKLGQGTRKAKDMKLNQNRQAILAMFWGAPVSVRDIQQRLVDAKIQRISNRHAGWNYHTVQADLSILLGMGEIEMIRPHQQEVFDKDHGHTTPSVPKYKRVIKNDQTTHTI